MKKNFITKIRNKLFRPNIEKMTLRKNIPGLIRCIGKEKWPNVQEQAITVLGNLHESRATEPLFNLVTNISAKSAYQINWSLHFSAIVSLGKIGDDKGVALLLALLEKGNDHYRTAAVAGLRYAPATPVVINALVKAMYDSRAGIAFSAAKSLKNRNYKPGQFNEHICFLTLNNERQELLKLGKTAVEPLIAMLNAPYAYDDANAASLKKYIIGILADTGDERAVEPLIGMLTCQYSYADIILSVYPDAMNALQKLGPIAVNSLKKTLETEKNSKKKERITILLQKITGQDYSNSSAE